MPAPALVRPAHTLLSEVRVGWVVRHFDGYTSYTRRQLLQDHATLTP
jgi:hypothetical protein